MKSTDKIHQLEKFAKYIVDNHTRLWRSTTSMIVRKDIEKRLNIPVDSLISYIIDNKDHLAIFGIKIKFIKPRNGFEEYVLSYLDHELCFMEKTVPRIPVK